MRLTFPPDPATRGSTVRERERGSDKAKPMLIASKLTKCRTRRESGLIAVWI